MSTVMATVAIKKKSTKPASLVFCQSIIMFLNGSIIFASLEGKTEEEGEPQHVHPFPTNHAVGAHPTTTTTTTTPLPLVSPPSKLRSVRIFECLYKSSNDRMFSFCFSPFLSRWFMKRFDHFNVLKSTKSLHPCKTYFSLCHTSSSDRWQQGKVAARLPIPALMLA